MPLSRSSGHETFPFGSEVPGVPGSCQPRAVEKCASLLFARVTDDRMAGSREREPRKSREKERRDKRSGGGEQKRKGGEKGKRGKEKAKWEEEIVHLSSCKVGKMDGTRNFPSQGSVPRRAAPLGHNLQSLTIRLDQPLYKGTYYVATLRRDSHGRFGCAIILHPARINQR